ncbi:FAD-dependent oxidoreductase, partial [bacterium]|nr:FAD-dependent oxidoreductase [bacterium]
MKYKNITILGAGITGLTCAYILAKKGYKVTVLEGNSECGGLARTFEINGCLSDLGPHQFCTDNQELIKLFEEILGSDMLIKHKKVAQFFQGKYVNYPLSVKDFIFNINPLLTLRIGVEVVFFRLLSLFKTRDDYCFQNWVENRFGKKMYKIYFGPYTKKVWGVDPETLDPSTASRRIAFNSIFDFIIKTLKFHIFKIGDYTRSHSPLKKCFYYSKLGMQTFINKLRDKCEGLGVDVRTNFNVTSFDILNDNIVGINSSNREKFCDFDLCISTIPITNIMEMLSYDTSIIPLRFRSMVVVILKINREIT